MGQRLQPRAELRVRTRVRELLDDPPRDRRREQRVAVGHDPDRVDELLGRRVLDQEAAGARLECLEHVLVALEGRQDHHPAVERGVRRDAPRRLEAVHVRHLDVHQHDIVITLGDCIECLAAVARDMHFVAALPNTHYFEYCVEQGALRQTLTKQKFPVIDGDITVPEEPGLGVDLDEAVVEKYCVR